MHFIALHLVSLVGSRSEDLQVNKDTSARVVQCHTISCAAQSRLSGHWSHVCLSDNDDGGYDGDGNLLKELKSVTTDEVWSAGRASADNCYKPKHRLSSLSLFWYAIISIRTDNWTYPGQKQLWRMNLTAVTPLEVTTLAPLFEQNRDHRNWFSDDNEDHLRM